MFLLSPTGNLMDLERYICLLSFFGIWDKKNFFLDCSIILSLIKGIHAGCLYRVKCTSVLVGLTNLQRTT